MPEDQTENVGGKSAEKGHEDLRRRVQELEDSVFGNKKVGHVGLQQEIKDIKDGILLKILNSQYYKIIPMLVGLVGITLGILSLIFKWI